MFGPFEGRPFEFVEGNVNRLLPLLGKVLVFCFDAVGVPPTDARCFGSARYIGQPTQLGDESALPVGYLGELLVHVSLAIMRRRRMRREFDRVVHASLARVDRYCRWRAAYSGKLFL